MSYRKFVKDITRKGVRPRVQVSNPTLFSNMLYNVLNTTYVEYDFPTQVLSMPSDVMNATLDAIGEGFIDLPNDHVAFETTYHDMTHILLASKDKDASSNLITFRLFNMVDKKWFHPGVHFNVESNVNGMPGIQAINDFGISESTLSADEVQVHLDFACSFLLGALTMLNTKGVTSKEKQQKARTFRGKVGTVKLKTSMKHTVILGVATSHMSGESTSIGSKQKWHIRRGHIRFRDHPTKKPIWIQPYAAGDMSLGFVEKDYKIKDMGDILYKNNNRLSR